MAPVLITSFYAGLCALVVIALIFQVERQRFKHRIGFGDGGQEKLTLAIRVHANAVENIPLALILLLLWELNGGPVWGIHLAGAGLVVSRALHAWGFSRSSGRSFGRSVGATGTWLVILVLALVLVVKGAMGMS
ncbi:MAG: uncharacterized protein V7606_2813 [Burkholderiales bacterium]